MLPNRSRLQSRSRQNRVCAATCIAAALFLSATVVPTARAAEKGPAPAVISHGAEITLADNLVANKATIFDFYSDACAPCLKLSPALEKLHAKRDGIAVVKVDIDRPGPGIKHPDLASPVARQFKLTALPHLEIHGSDGKLLATGGLAMDIVLRWLDSIDENPFKGFSRTW